jgi:hypothetical protein
LEGVRGSVVEWFESSMCGVTSVIIAGKETGWVEFDEIA